MSYLVGSLQMPKWQLALLIGTPLAIGMGIYLMKKHSSDRPAEEAGGPISKSSVDRSQKRTNDKTKKKRTSTLDGTKEDRELERLKKVAELENKTLTPLNEANMYKIEGNYCYCNGKYDEAIRLYGKAIDKCPEINRTDMAVFYQNRAAAYEMLRKWDCVKADCTKSLECNPRYVKAYFRRAKAYEATQNLTDCLDDLSATCILEKFDNNNTIMYTDGILKRMGRLDAEKHMKTRKPMLPSKHFIRTYINSFISDPLMPANTTPQPKQTNGVDAEPLHGFLRAKEALAEESFEDIIPACTEEIDSPTSEYKMEAHLLRGTFNLLSADFEQALRDFDAVINSDNADKTLRTYAYIKRASLKMQVDQNNDGLDDFTRAEELMPNLADIFHQRAQVYVLLDNIGQALKEIEKAVELAPNFAVAYIQKCYVVYRLSLLSQDQERLMMVRKEFKNVIDKFPDCVDSYNLMAQVLGDQQQYAEADQFFEKALKIAPDNATLYVHRAVLLLQWKCDVDEAIKLMLHAIEVDDKCGLAYETLGTAEVQRANLDRAVELFEKAIEVAKSQSEMCHLFSLRNAAVAQINVTRKLGIDMSSISSMVQANGSAQNGAAQ